MVKAYLRYEPAASFGVIVSGESNIAYDSSGKHLLAPALEKIGIWHVKQSLCTKTLAPFPSSNSKGPSLTVTSIASSSSFHVNLDFLLFIFQHPLVLLLETIAEIQSFSSYIDIFWPLEYII